MIFVSFFIRSLLLVSIPVLLILPGFGTDYQDTITKREKYATEGKGDIVVVAIKEAWADNYINGIKLAINEINARDEKLLGRKVRLRIEEAREDYQRDRPMVMKIAEDPEVTAVLGHHRTEDAIPASVIYEQSEVIFMPPLSTGKDTTAHNFRYVFRMIPHNGVMAKQLASVAKLLGYKNIALLYSYGYSRRELAFLFEDAAVELNMHFAARRSFNAEQVDYRDLISQFSKDPIDMVFLSTDTKSGARMINQLREMGITAPIMGGNSLNLGPLKELVGEAGEDTIVPAFYRPRDTSLHQNFNKNYKEQYGKSPDQNAAQGYDSMSLLAYAIQHGNSAHPKKISSTLHHLPYWRGLTGVHAFDERGDVIGKKYFFQILKGGQWQWLPVVHFPYFLWQFDKLIGKSGDNSAIVPQNGFVRAFVRVRNDEDIRILQLRFIHQIFKFKRFGVIYAEDNDSEVSRRLAKIQAVAKDGAFQLDTCGITQQGVTSEDIEKQLVRCLGKLSLKIDMLNITGLDKVDMKLMRKLQAPLEEYKIPIISLQGDPDLGDLATVRLGKFSSIYNTRSEGFINLFSGIVRNQKVHEFTDKVANLPVMEVNLGTLDRYNLLRTTPIVQLSPDFLIESPTPPMILPPKILETSLVQEKTTQD